MQLRADVCGVFFLCWIVGSAHASVQVDAQEGLWRDNFTNLSGLAINQQGARFTPSGYTIDQAIQIWTQPSSTVGQDELFSSSTQRDPTVVIENPGSPSEFLTLWNRRYDPGGSLQIAEFCDTRGRCSDPPFSTPPNRCPTDQNYSLNGVVSDTAISNAYGGACRVPGVGWDTACPSPPPAFTLGPVQGIECTCLADLGLGLGCCSTPPGLGTGFCASFGNWGEVALVEDLVCDGLTQNNAINLPSGVVMSGLSLSQSIGQFYRQRLLYGADERGMETGYGYSVSFVVAAALNFSSTLPPAAPSLHITHMTTPYLMFQLYETVTNAAHLSTTLYEGDFLTSGFVNNFNLMTPVTLNLTPGLNSTQDAEWDFQVWSQTDIKGRENGHPHCTIMGPVWVTADRGSYSSPVLDTLSNDTRWVDIGWDLDQTTHFIQGTSTIFYIDSPASAIPPGSPLTPVKLSYQIGYDQTSFMTVFNIEHGGEAAAGLIGMNMVNLSSTTIRDTAWQEVSGRYFQWTVTLYGRGAAKELDSDLAPANGINANSGQPYPDFVHFGGFRPSVNRINARYFACAARATSQRIAPASVKRWITANYVTELPSPGATVKVDVLGSDGQIAVTKDGVSLEDIPSGAPDVPGAKSVARLDPYKYPSLTLRVALESDPADCDKRPILKAWEVRWEPMESVTMLNCNSIRPQLGEICTIQVRVKKAGRVKVAVHDAAGQSVNILLDKEVPAEALLLTWDGRNEHGELVAPGVYFVVVRVPGGRQVRRLAVLR